MSDEQPDLHSLFDCIIIGGGPAGLTCSIFLGRYRRRVLVIDAGKPRNYASHAIHGFLGHHAISPRELLRLATTEARNVGVEFLDATVSRVEKVGDTFEAISSKGVARGRRVVLAYGVRDIFPDIPDFHAFYGKGIFHCPDCDGYEARDKPIGVIASGKRAAGLSLRMLQWSDDIAIFTNGAELDLGEEEMSKLHAEGIRVHTERISSLFGEGDSLAGLELESGQRFEVPALFFSLGVERSCLLAEDTGCDVFDDIPNIRVDDHKETSVPGVYAVGDLVPGSQLAITSAADGAIAAIALNKTLLPPSRQV